MDISDKKKEILMVALDLFSKNGYEATSLAQIADAVGIRKASLYFHFESKQDILDSLVSNIVKEYDDNSLFSIAEWDNPDFVRKVYGDLSPETVARKAKEQVHYIVSNPYVSKVRKMVLIEQFRNENFAKEQTKRNYEDVFEHHRNFMKYLIKAKKVKGLDPEIMAAQYAFPISMWISLCDREPEREGEVMDLIDRHVKQFFEVYKL